MSFLQQGSKTASPTGHKMSNTWEFWGHSHANHHTWVFKKINLTLEFSGIKMKEKKFLKCAMLFKINLHRLQFTINHLSEELDIKE